MTGEKIRFHPSVVLENLMRFAIFAVIFLLVSVEERPIEAFLAIGGLLGVAAIILFLRWRRTTVQFNENELIVERNTIFKMKRSIPYSKIASINVNRTIISRMFGTSRLQVNVNSSSNATVPEAVLVFKKDLADRIRNHLSRNMYDSEPVIEAEQGSVVNVDNTDVLVHGLFSQSTMQTISGFIFLAWSIFEMYSDAGGSTGGSSALSLGMFFFVTVVPSVMLIVHYANFKVYRVKDTIYLQHGLISTYRTSFNVSRINAIHVKSTMASRLMGRSYIEADVIGLGSSKDSQRPVLCLLKRNDVIEAVLKDLVPEFVYDRNIIVQPKGAKKAIAAKASLGSAFVAVMAAALTWVVGTTDRTGLSGIERTVVENMFIAAGAAIVLAIILWGYRSYRVKELSLGEDLFTFVNGVVDRRRTTMCYDKVQIVNVSKGPLARRFGLAVGSISLLSSKGSVSVSSGYFTEADLNKVHETVMQRLVNGKYDHRANEI
ncbi:MAG: PH domain-containing protein [Euryarchaeota archaeon]|nr:PH domain-containing protein [Euryarchaeota archaeon]